MSTTEQTPQLPSETKLAVPLRKERCLNTGDLPINARLFNVRDANNNAVGCQLEEREADAIVTACNAFYAPSPANAEAGDEVAEAIEWIGDVANMDLGWIPLATERFDKAITALLSLAAVRAERDAARDDAKACSIQLTEMHTEKLRVEQKRLALARENEGLREGLRQAHDLLGKLCGNDIHNATARDAVGAAFLHIRAALAPVSL